MAKNVKKDGKKNDSNFVDFVSQDKDWRGVVDNELRCQEGWHKVWGFLSDETMSEKPLTKDEKISVIEEKIKSMKDVKMMSLAKQSYKGGEIDFKINSYNRLQSELMPQSRRPKAISKSHAHLVEKVGPDYALKPYENYLGSK